MLHFCVCGSQPLAIKVTITHNSRNKTLCHAGQVICVCSRVGVCFHAFSCDYFWSDINAIYVYLHSSLMTLYNIHCMCFFGLLFLQIIINGNGAMGERGGWQDLCRRPNIKRKKCAHAEWRVQLNLTQTGLGRVLCALAPSAFSSLAHITLWPSPPSPPPPPPPPSSNLCAIYSVPSPPPIPSASPSTPHTGTII